MSSLPARLVDLIDRRVIEKLKNKLAQIGNRLLFMVSEEQTSGIVLLVVILAFAIFILPAIPQTNLHVILSQQGEISNMWVVNERVSPYLSYKSVPNENITALYTLELVTLNRSTNKTLNYVKTIKFTEKVVGEHTIRLPDNLSNRFVLQAVFKTGEKTLDTKEIDVTLYKEKQ